MKKRSKEIIRAEYQYFYYLHILFLPSCVLVQMQNIPRIFSGREKHSFDTRPNKRKKSQSRFFTKIEDRIFVYKNFIRIESSPSTFQGLITDHWITSFSKLKFLSKRKIPILHSSICSSVFQETRINCDEYGDQVGKLEGKSKKQST